MGKLDANDPIFSKEYNEKIGFVTPMASLWYFKINWPSVLFISAICISFLFITDWLCSFFLGIDFQSGLFLPHGMWWIYVIVFLIGLAIAFKIDKKIFYLKRKFNQDGDTEILGDLTITHHFITAKTIRWHYVEAGPTDAEVIIFMHGVPESWYCWHHQIRDFSKDYHVFAFDLKGYGQSDKKFGDYRWEAVTEEFIAVIDKLGLDKFNYVAHDRGTVLGDYLGGMYPERIIRFVRGQQVLHKWTPVRSPQEHMWIRPIVGTLANSFPRVIIPGAYSRWYSYSRIKIPRKEVKRAILEYSYPKIRWTVPHYFRSNGFAKEVADRKNRLLKNMNFPVLLLEAELDPFQPKYYFEGYEELFPKAQIKFIEGASHFWPIEKPKVVTQIIKDFLRDMKVK